MSLWNLKPLALSLGLLLMAGLIARAEDDDEASMRYKFHEGQTLRYKLTESRSSKTSALENAGETRHEQTTEFVRVTKSVGEDGIAVVTETVRRIHYSQDLLAGKIEYDSEQNKPVVSTIPNPTALLASLIDEESTYTLSPFGDCGKIEPSKKTEAVIRAMPELKGMAASFLSDGVKLTKELTGLKFPNQELQAGSVWKSEPVDTDFHGEKCAYSCVNTLVGPETRNGKDLIKVSRTFESVPNSATNKSRVELRSNELTANAWFDPVAGILVESELNQKHVVFNDRRREDGKLYVESTLTCKMTLKLQQEDQ